MSSTILNLISFTVLLQAALSLRPNAAPEACLLAQLYIMAVIVLYMWWWTLSSLRELLSCLLICCLQAALSLRPDAVSEACLLAQLYMVAGHPHDALDTARALRLAAPADADAHALYILLREAQGETERDDSELAQAYLELLRCDPSSGHAVQGNLDFCLIALQQTSFVRTLAVRTMLM